MGNSKSKKVQREPDKNASIFERERWREQVRVEKKKKKTNPANKRMAVKEQPPQLLTSPKAAPAPVPAAAAPANLRSYDDEALDRMRYQLRNDSDAFLLNNILLSVQFFENYERETQYIKNNPISDREHLMDEAMVRRHKHVFFADRLQECVYEHVSYQRRRGHQEPLSVPRHFVIYDNVEASEPGDTSDYSAVLDAPFYKLVVEDCKEPGYVKLKKLEVLESTLAKETETPASQRKLSGDSIFSESGKESNDSDSIGKGTELLQKLESKLNDLNTANSIINKNIKLNSSATVELSGRRRSGPMKQLSLQAEKSNIANLSMFKNSSSAVSEETEKQNMTRLENLSAAEYLDMKPRKSILKNVSRSSGAVREIKLKAKIENYKLTLDNSAAEDTETSGYRSTTSSKQNESSETESDYGYSTIKESTTPKKLELKSSNQSAAYGVLPDECWSVVQVKAINEWSDDEDEDSESRSSGTPNLYETNHYLSSLSFMHNFVDNFIIDLGCGLGLSKDAIENALTQGASIYCDTIKSGSRMSCEIFPALIAAWPNAANQWIIRERKIIQNPRTNSLYQWPTKYMVNKAISFGCLLVPIGFRPKRGLNSNQALQWRIIFPAAERYLESCLAHSHVRCYLFALALHKTFMETGSSKIGVDATHVKNHLFWQCEDNYAMWPEDRLGETLRIFLRTFYAHFGQGRFPNYFIDTCNDFKSIPKPVLLRHQRQLLNIIEAPVMHLLYALDKIKYTNNKEFYPSFNCQRLYDILTSKNPLRIINPNLPELSLANRNNESSDSEDDTRSFWDKTKDKQYLWKKEKQRQIQEKRRIYTRKQKATQKQEREINPKIILPAKMEVERRRLVLEFFISHFIAMARSSERFEAIKQAVIYLEQAQRLCILLQEEPGGDDNASEFMDVIYEKLADCQRKLVNQSGFKLPPRRESQVERASLKPLRKIRPKYQHIVAQESPTENPGIQAFSFVDVHAESTRHRQDLKIGKYGEESKL